MADPGWQTAALVLGGGLAGFAAMLALVLGAEAWGGTDADEGILPALALATVLASAAAWRRPRLRLAIGGAATVHAFFAFFALGLWLACGLLLAAGAAWAVWQAPAPLRLLLGVPFVWGAALLVATLAAASDGFAPVSGLALAALGLAYPVAWALREEARWARNAAWALALLWCAVAAAYAAADLAAFGDGLAVAAAAFLAVAFVAILVAWPVHARRAARAAPA